MKTKLLMLFAFLSCLFAAPLCAQVAKSPAARIEFELFTEGQVSSATQQAWLQALSKLEPKGLRIRTGQTSDTPKVETVGAGPTASFRVIGKITERGELQLTGGKFTSRDTAGISRWIETLSDQGAPSLTEKKVRFGLSEKQLTEVRSEMSAPITFSTLNEPVAKAVARIQRDIELGTTTGHKVVIEAELAKALPDAAPLKAELQGLSRGTALAILLRRVDAVWQPHRVTGNEIELILKLGKPSNETWPCGWETEQADAKLIPKLVDSLNIEIDGVAVSETLAAIGQRLAVPMIIDQHTLDEKKIDLGTKIKLPVGKTNYGRLLRDVLGKIKCHYQIRVDENDKLFIWITGT